jgi:DNA-binding MarR family transcriptional regulator
MATDFRGTTSFLLGTTGVLVARRYADRIEHLDLKPKHVGILTLLAGSPAESQLDLARTMRIAPSLVVRLGDHLEGLGAVERTRDPADRRRQTLRLTDHGRALLAECTAIADTLDAELLAAVPEPDRAGLHDALAGILAALVSEPFVRG